MRPRLSGKGAPRLRADTGPLPRVPVKPLRSDLARLLLLVLYSSRQSAGAHTSNFEAGRRVTVLANPQPRLCLTQHAHINWCHWQLVASGSRRRGKLARPAFPSQSGVGGLAVIPGAVRGPQWGRYVRETRFTSDLLVTAAES
jgi:hypothetical protein